MKEEEEESRSGAGVYVVEIVYESWMGDLNNGHFLAPRMHL